LPCQDLYPASAKIIISGFAENVCLSRRSRKATEAVPCISPALKALRPEKTASQTPRPPSPAPPALICEGELCVLARLCKALKTVADRVSLYADRDGKDYRLAIHLPQSKSSESRIGIIRHIVSEYRLPLYTDLSRMSDTEEYYTLLTDKATELLPDCF